MSANSRNFWNFYSAGRLVFGSGAVDRLPILLQPAVPRRVLIIADKHLSQCDITTKVKSALISAGCEVVVFDDGQPEPSFAVADAAITAARAARPDAIVGVGGGSNLDLAKITAAVLTHGGSYRDYFGYNRIPGPTLPLILIPTTSGTGSEVSHAAVLTDTEQQVKVSTLSQYLRPQLAIVDPRLSISCPPRPTAHAGMDALTHAIEAYTACHFDQLDVPVTEPFPYDGKHPLGDVLAEKAIRLIGQHLATAVHEPNNLAAREGMALAATLAGLAFSNCAVAVVHALEYPIGGAVHVSHGEGNGLLLPHVMRFNLSHRSGELAEIAGWLGADVTGLTTEAAAEQAITAVEKLLRSVSLERNLDGTVRQIFRTQLRELGVAPDQLPEFAKKSFAIKRLMLLNGRPPTEADLLAILEAAY